MKAITDVFLRHPVLAMVLNLALVMVGIRAAMQLPVQQFPKLESSSIGIRTFYIGASAETVRGFLTTPIERAVSSIAGIDYIESSSTAGMSQITVRLKLNHSSTQALTEVTARLQQVRRELPQEAEPPVVFVQRADRRIASFYLSFTSDKLDIAGLTDWLGRTIQPQLAILEGVQGIGIEAGRMPAMRVWISPERLSTYNLTAGDIYSALQRNNFLAAIGRVKNAAIQVDLVTNTDLRTVEEFEDLIVSQRDGASIRLRDVARVELGAEEAGAIAMYQGKEAVYVSVWPLPGVNEIEVAHRLKAEMERLRGTLPEHVDMQLAFDSTTFMEEALKEIFKTLIETIAIVGLVVFLFMGSLRTAIVPLVAMPVSLVGATLLMLLMGFSLNLLTLLAIVLSVGLVVDDAIVVVENIQRHVQEGMTRMRAAIVGARELVGPIIAMTITLAVVYTPIGFQGGLTGMLFKEFAFTLAAAVIVSGLVAVTLSPIMSAKTVDAAGRERWLTRLVNRLFGVVRRIYRSCLGLAIELRWAIIASTLLIAAAAAPLYRLSDKELAPVEDQSNISVALQNAPDSTLESTSAWTRVLTEKLGQLPETSHTWAIAFPNSGFGGIHTVDFRHRQRTTMQMLDEVYRIVATTPGVRAFPSLPPSLPGSDGADVELIIKTDDPPEQLTEQIQTIIGQGMATGSFRYLDCDLKLDLPQARIDVDRDRIADMGLDLAGVGRELGVLLGGGYVNRFNFFNRSYQVIPQLAESDRENIDALMDLKIRSPSGELVSVSNIASVQPSLGPRSLQRFQQQSCFRISGGVADGVTKGDGLETLEGVARRVMGPAVAIDYGGESRQIRTEGSALTVTLGFALVLIYLTLTAQFGSFRDPMIVLLGSVPLAISGALVLTFLGLTTINIYSQVGLITLVGLVAKNGILIVEFANSLQEQGLAKLVAILEAAETRLRPVLMTSAATILGHLPLVFVTGPGAEARNSIGIVLVAGMAIGTIFTLFVVPALYYVLAADHQHRVQAWEDSDWDELPVGGPGPSLIPAAMPTAMPAAADDDRNSLAG
ncbi:MAG: efflux RND transporter permease subunit [Pirellulales bacterium]